jgi:hypothetical protein
MLSPLDVNLDEVHLRKSERGDEVIHRRYRDTLKLGILLSLGNNSIASGKLRLYPKSQAAILVP